MAYCLYNGVKLPNIDSINMDDAYSKCYLRFVDGSYSLAYVLSGYDYYIDTNNTLRSTNGKRYTYITYAISQGEWDYIDIEFGADYKSLTGIFWSNFDIYSDADLSYVAFSASDPILVVTDPIDPKALLMGSRVGQMISGMRNKPKEEA